MKLKIETTADGSPTFYREDIDEHYHSITPGTLGLVYSMVIFDRW